MIDATHQISGVERRVGSRVLPAGAARVLTISQTYDAPVSDVWDACTDPARIARWFLPVNGDLRLHGRYQFEGNAGGEIQRCNPPESFAATWEMGEQMSWIEVRLTPEPDDRTRFTLEHVAHVDDVVWAEFGPGAVGIGWDMGLLGLATYLRGDDGGDDIREQGAAWAASDEGRQFVVTSSRHWGEADIASGTDPDVAAAAAARTTAAYLGDPAA
ncbi:SRPBCC family protein [Micromonospora sp. RTGN7]|uniref:SRPBCC family protein n=1 Tax=Micromonospora sp. RTGN7 TaxID=3016526 RepID=UPI0029FEE6EC|nr:SRPBCC family protein [Micromonospora sp. RTGN7]